MSTPGAVVVFLTKQHEALLECSIEVTNIHNPYVQQAVARYPFVPLCGRANKIVGSREPPARSVFATFAAGKGSRYFFSMVKSRISFGLVDWFFPTMLLPCMPVSLTSRLSGRLGSGGEHRV